MAIGAGWADGAWVDAGWVTAGDGAWAQDAGEPGGGGASGLNDLIRVGPVNDNVKFVAVDSPVRRYPDSS